MATLVALLYFVVFEGAASALEAWRPGADTTDVHRWHTVLYGLFSGPLLGGALLVLIPRPRAVPAAMRLYVVLGVLLAGVELLAQGSRHQRGPGRPAARCLPRPRALLRFGPARTGLRPLVALTAAAAVVELAVNLQRQLTDTGSTHLGQGHWLGGMGLAVAVVLAAALAVAGGRADDHYVFREGLRTLLATFSGVDVVGEASTCPGAVAAAEQLRPDVVFMDLGMPGGTGVAATRAVRERVPDARVLVLTMFADSGHVADAVGAGAHGYLLKDAGPEEILRSLEAVAAGQFVLGAGLSGQQQLLTGSARSHPLPELSDREREVLTLMSGGAGNDHIARHLGLTVKTVRNHVSNIYANLLVADRAAAVLKARDAGLGHRPPG